MPVDIKTLTPAKQAACALMILAAPYGHLENVGALRLEVRPKPDKGQQVRPVPRRWFGLTTDSLWEAAQFAVDAGQVSGVQMSVLPRLGEAGDGESVNWCGALWASVDDNDGGSGSALAHLHQRLTEASLPAPHIILSSGGGIHAAWCLSSPVLIDSQEVKDRVQSAVRRLGRAIGGEAPGPASETNTSYLSYMLRVPGSLNHKVSYERPRLVRLVRADVTAERKPLVWWRAHLPPDPAPKPARKFFPPKQDVLKELPADVLAAISGSSAPGKHHDTAVQIAAKAQARGYVGDTLRVLLEAFASNAGWRVEKNEIRQIMTFVEKGQSYA